MVLEVATTRRPLVYRPYITPYTIDTNTYVLVYILYTHILYMGETKKKPLAEI